MSIYNVRSCNLAVQAFLMLRSVACLITIPESEYLSLYDFYNATNGVNWDIEGVPWQFSTEVNPCTQNWQGITCRQTNSSYHVVNLTLAECNLVGTLPVSIAGLAQLQHIDLNSNKLYSHIDALGQLSQLAYIDLHDNALSGAVPASFSELTELLLLDLELNHLTGTLPPFLADLASLEVLDLRVNSFSGPISEVLANLTSLRILMLSGNALTGSIPPCLCNLTQLSFLSIGASALNGTIPACLWHLPQLTFVDISFTVISGSIPEFPPTSMVEKLHLVNNSLSGTIPTSIGLLPHLQKLSLFTNRLHGFMPSTLGSTANLYFVDLSENLLSGSVPNTLCSSYVAQLSLRQNLFVGTLPGALRNMTRLVALDLSNNFLHGPIRGLDRLESLTSLALQANRLTGSLAGAFNATVQSFLETVQLDYNQLTGTLPAELFRLPALGALSIVESCLHGTLPNNICQSSALEALILYGLTTGESCRAAATSTLSLRPQRAFGGSLPSCLLSLAQMRTLLLSGNSLTGTVPAQPLGKNLVQLDLSHNLLSGTISTAIQNRTWLLLDLSHNKIGGTLHPELFHAVNRTSFFKTYFQVDDDEYVSETVEEASNLSPTLTLLSNRLSGKLPGTINHMHNLSVLAGNLFSCNYAQNDLPKYDDGVDTYECASNSFDISVYVWLAALTTIVAFGVYYHHFQWVNVVSVEIYEKLPDVHTLLHKCHFVLTRTCYLTCVCVFVLMPCYITLTVFSGTHTHQYAYVLSAIYTRGVAPFVIYFILWGLILCLAYVTTTASFTANKSSAAQHLQRSVVTMSAIYLTVNVVVVLGVNIAFIAVVLRGSAKARTVAQIALSVFKLVWNTTSSPYLLRQLRAYYLTNDTSNTFFLLQLSVALFNTIAIPCLVVVASDPNCFSDLFVPKPIKVQFGAPFCTDVDTTNGVCEGSNSSMYYIDYSPPFTYSYQCSASFVTSYAPAFIYMSLSTVLLDPLLQYMCVRGCARLRPGSLIHNLLSRCLSRLLRIPTLPLPNAGRSIVGAVAVVVTLVTHIGILLTFGVVFPPVALAMVVSASATVYIFRYKLRRFLNSVVELHLFEYLSAINAECSKAGTSEEMRHAMKIVICYCCAFYTLFLFDTLGDARGFAAAAWILIVVPLAPFVVYSIGVFVRRFINNIDRGESVMEPSTEQELEMKVVNSSVAVANPILVQVGSV